MYFAIIDASSDISRLTTIAYGDTASEVALWFAEEFRDNYEMYANPDEAGEHEDVLSQCDDICDLARNDALDLSDIDGLSFTVGDIDVSVVGAYETYEDFREGFLAFIDDKPKYKKILPEEYPDDEINECDRINTLLVRASI